MNDNKENYTEHYMIPFNQARQLVIDSTDTLTPQLTRLEQSLNRVLAEDLSSPVNVPPFHNSAMDGYAVNAADLEGASQSSPVVLELIGITAAGEESNAAENSQGKAWKIMTGAPVPAGFDSIIPVENTLLEGQQVTCFSQPKSGAHIRRAGEDFVAREKFATAGSIINANAVMALSALGIGQMQTYPIVDVAVFSTGKELVDDPDVELRDGQIRNSNKPFILEWFNNLPVNAFDAGTNFDEVEKFEKDLKAQLDKGTSIIISSGAVSMGDFDFIPQTIQKLGGQILFHKSKIKPGKPILFAKFPNGTLYFGLPGNPISAAIGLRFFVSACLRKLIGLAPERPLAAIASCGVNKKQGFRSILKANAHVNSDACLQVDILDGQESFKIKPLLNANGWALVEESIQSLVAGEKVEFYPSAMVWE